MSFASLRRRALLPVAATIITLVPLTLTSGSSPAAAAKSNTVKAKSDSDRNVSKKRTKKKRKHLSKKVRRSNKPRHIAHRMVERKHDWSHRQYKCVRALWHRESGWRVKAANRYSGAYGIPQAMPGHKMGRGWRTSARAQIRWGLQYIDDRYDTPCKADRHQRTRGWY